MMAKKILGQMRLGRAILEEGRRRRSSSVKHKNSLGRRTLLLNSVIKIEGSSRVANRKLQLHRFMFLYCLWSNTNAGISSIRQTSK